MHFRRLVLLALGAFAGPLAAADPPPADKHYVLVFGGYQDSIRIRTGHTWGTFVRTSTRPDGAIQLDPVTISWMPSTLRVRPYAFRSEPGNNLTLEETISWISGPRSNVSAWGPYEITPEVFAQAQHRAAFLEAVNARYRVFDRFDRLPDVEHCIHALTRVDPRWELQARPTKGNGVHGTTHVVRDLLRSGAATQPTTQADWVYNAMGLDKTGFTRR